MLINIFMFFMNRKEREMMAMLFATKIILGKKTFDMVPKMLKKQVAEILIDECGLPELVPTEFGGTLEG